MHHALDLYGLLSHGRLNQQACRDRLDTIVDAEIPIFIYHEVGEEKQATLDSDTLKRLIGRFPDSAIEYVARTIKDILADTHPQGMLGFIIKEKREASLGFYAGFLDGLRKMLFPELHEAFRQFVLEGDREPLELVQQRFNREVLEPLGLDVPEGKN